MIGDPHQATLAEIWSALMGLAAIASPEAAAGPSQVIVRHVLYPLAAGALPIGLMAAAAIYAMVLRIAGPGRRLGRQPH